MRVRTPAIGTLVFLLLLFPACGGGGGDGNGTNPTGPYTPSGQSMSAAEEALANAILTEINNYRGTRGLGPYTWHAAAAQVGYDHSLDMDVRNFWDHANPDGLDGSARIAAAGITHDPGPGLIPPNFAGENLYAGWCLPAPCTFTLIPADVLDDGGGGGWINSPGHHTQLVAPQSVPGAQTMPAWTHCGIGVHTKADGSKTWVTAVFLRNPN